MGIDVWEKSEGAIGTVASARILSASGVTQLTWAMESKPKGKALKRFLLAAAEWEMETESPAIIREGSDGPGGGGDSEGSGGPGVDNIAMMLGLLSEEEELSEVSERKAPSAERLRKLGGGELVSEEDGDEERGT